MHRLRGGTPHPNSSLSLVGRLLASKAKQRRLAAGCVALGVAALSYTLVWERFYMFGLHVRAAQGEDPQLPLTPTPTPNPNPNPNPYPYLYPYPYH